MDQTTISKWENKTRPPRDRSSVERLAAAVGATAEELLQGIPPTQVRLNRILPTATLHPAIASVVNLFGGLLTDADWQRAAAYIQGLADGKQSGKHLGGPDADSSLDNQQSGGAASTTPKQAGTTKFSLVAEEHGQYQV
jgi:hypothetical protein